MRAMMRRARAKRRVNALLNLKIADPQNRSLDPALPQDEKGTPFAWRRGPVQ
jgi:hypothetical protein